LDIEGKVFLIDFKEVIKHSSFYQSQSSSSSLYLLRTAISSHQYSIRKLNLYLKASMLYSVLKYEQEGQNMPTVIIEADEGRTVEQKRGLVKDITDAVCRNFKVPPDSVTIFIHEGKKENRGKAGKLAID